MGQELFLPQIMMERIFTLVYPIQIITPSNNRLPLWNAMIWIVMPIPLWFLAPAWLP